MKFRSGNRKQTSYIVLRKTIFNAMEIEFYKKKSIKSDF